MREISSHPSLYCVNDPVAHFGTGDYTEVEVVVHFQSLAMVDTAGVEPGQMIIITEPTPTSVQPDFPPIPEDFMSMDAYPNPFNSSATITLSSSVDGEYTFAIYDMLGRLVKDFAPASLTNGTLSVTWNGTDSRGNAVPSGVYYVRAASRGISTEMKVTLLK